MLIKPVNPKGNQPWTFIGSTDAEAPILWPPDVMSRLTGKDPDVGEDWRQEEKGTTEDEMVGWHHQLNGAKCGRQWRTGKPGMLQSMRSQQRVGHDWATEQQQLCSLQVQSKVIPWYTYIPTLFQILFPYRLLQNIEYYSVCYIVGPCRLLILYTVVCVWCVYTWYVLDKAGDFLEPHCPLSVQWLWMMATVYMPSILHKAVFKRSKWGCWLCCGVNSFLCLIFILCGLWLINSVVLVSGVRSIHSLFIFNQRIIALQYCVGICHTTTWVSHKYIYVPSLLNLLPLPPPHPPPPRVISEHQAGLPTLHSSSPLPICFTRGCVCTSVLLCPFIPPSPSPAGSTSPFHASASLFLPKSSRSPGARRLEMTTETSVTK